MRAAGIKYKRNLYEHPFYEPGYIPSRDTKTEIKVDLMNPKKICEFLLERVYKQDDYCRDASMILYNHLRGITTRNIVCGPSGCGKTLVWQSLKKVFPRIIFVDSSTLTKTGWKGNNNISDFLKKVDVDHQNCIIVFDEFDKCVAPQHTTGGENVSANLQSEFLKILEGAEFTVKTEDGEKTVDTSKMSFVLCGSFGAQAETISERKSSGGFGFGVERKKPEMFEEELTVRDLIDYGLIREVASRVTRVINIRPLTLADYRYLITSHSASPIRRIEEIYGMKLSLSKKKIDEIARSAYESGLGIRNVTAQLQQIMDRRIFESFDEAKKPEEVKTARRKSGKTAKDSGKPEQKGEEHAV